MGHQTAMGEHEQEHDAEELLPEEIEEDEPALLDDPEFGEQDDAAQEAEWSEDAAEGGARDY